MEIKCPKHNGPGILIVGILRALRYEPLKRVPDQNVSYSIFMTSVRKLGEYLLFHADPGNSLLNVNSFIRSCIRSKDIRIDDSYNSFEYNDGTVVGAVPIPNGAKEPEMVAFRLEPWNEVFKFKVHIQSPDKTLYQTLIMMQWMLMDHAMSTDLIEIDGHQIKMGLMLAAKLYKLHGDVVGELATIDEAYDGH